MVDLCVYSNTPPYCSTKGVLKKKKVFSGWKLVRTLSILQSRQVCGGYKAFFLNKETSPLADVLPLLAVMHDCLASHRCNARESLLGHEEGLGRWKPDKKIVSSQNPLLNGVQ